MSIKQREHKIDMVTDYVELDGWNQSAASKANLLQDYYGFELYKCKIR